MKTALTQQFRHLAELIGVSGAEQPVVRYLRDTLQPWADEITIDNIGNLVATKKGCRPGPKLLVAAHSDEIGFCVKNILDDGYVLFDRIGWSSEQLLVGRKIWLGENKIPGVIGIKAGHLQTPEESRSVRPLRDCYIDLGASSRKEVEDMGVKIGDSIVLQSDFMHLHNPDMIATKSVDNRIGCALAVELFRLASEMDFAGTLCVAFAVREELGQHGIPLIGDAVQPDYAIVLDTIPAGDTPDIDTDRQLPVRLGHGPACPIADGVANCLIFQFIHPKVRAILEQQAQKLALQLQYLTLISDSYTTDAAALALSGQGGIPVGLIAIPRRYSHSPIELLNINDAVDALRLLVGVLENNQERDFSFL